MGSKSKSAHKKKKISKHVLKSRAEKAASQSTTTPSDPEKSAQSDALKGTSNKRKQKKNRRMKDSSEIISYLEQWKESQNGKPGWKFNKNTQSWIIRHMYAAEKVPKGIFTLALEYLSGVEGKATRSWIRSEASRRALRYKNLEKKKTEIEGEPNTEVGVAEDNGKKATTKALGEEEREDEDRWQKLSDHDKRKEYKRARKILETLKD